MAEGCAGPCGGHGARWALPLRPPLCLACAVETLGDGSASVGSACPRPFPGRAAGRGALAPRSRRLRAPPSAVSVPFS